MTIQKKVCLLGPSSVGKTSLVRRFVYSVFSGKYLTTLGVKIDRKVVSLAEREMSLVIWDIQGEDEFAHVLPTYIRGASGWLLVADGTRRRTLDEALDLGRRVAGIIGELPGVFILNKSDLASDWEVGEEDTDALRTQGWHVITTSAKSGVGVDEAFLTLAHRMLPV